MAPLQIAGRKVGAGAPCLVVGEVAQAHDGSLGLAHAYIDAIAAAGADAVKFQTHIASEESTPDEPFRVKFSRQDASRFAYWKRMEFTPEQWQGLADHARAKGLLFLSSPFSLAAVELLEKVGVPAWKVASGEVANAPMLERMSASGLPLLVSTGMSPMAEVDALVGTLSQAAGGFALLQCTTAYPCPPDRVGLNVMQDYAQRYGCVVGLSDHSGTIFPSLAAVAHGANVLEVHVTMSREMFGPDVPASVTTTELVELVKGVRFIEAMLANPVDKDAMSRETAHLRALFGRSVVARRDIGAGSTLREADLIAKKPGTGIPGSAIPQIVGRRLRKSVARDQLLTLDDLEPEERSP